jgi:hypothetical protein
LFGIKGNKEQSLVIKEEVKGTEGLVVEGGNDERQVTTHGGRFQYRCKPRNYK